MIAKENDGNVGDREPASAGSTVVRAPSAKLSAQEFA
jgi:hypothetical protein